MSSPTKYYVTSADGSFINWHSNITGLETRGQSLTIDGSSGNDQVLVGLGTTVNASKMTATEGKDSIYLTGNFTDYTTKTHVGSEYTLSRTVNIDGTDYIDKVTFVVSDGDKLYFADGFINIGNSYLKTSTGYKSLNDITYTPSSDPNNQTPTFPLISVPAIKNPTTTTVFITDPDGTNITSGIRGSIFDITSSKGDDTVYVNKGTIVNASKMTATEGADAIYLTGNFTDYSQSNTDSVYVFTRSITIDGSPYTEKVTFVASNGDKLYFADGFIDISLTNLQQNGVFVSITDGTDGTRDMLDESAVTPGLEIDLTITNNKPNTIKNGETITYTFIFDEAVAGFEKSDIAVSNGTQGTFTKINDAKYTLVVIPNANFEGNLLVSVAKDVATNGIAKTLAASTMQVVDTQLPTMTITSEVNELKTGETATITFTLSEVSTDFVASDITVAGGVLSNFALRSGETKVYTATFTPAASSTTTGTISVANGKFTDAVGNNNADGSDTNNSVSLTIDTIIPTIAITSEVNALKAGETAIITFTLSEVSTDFVASDITVTGGVLSNFALKFGETKIYTATFTPAENSTTAGTISVANGKFTDVAGNNNANGADTSNAVSLTIDTIIPTIAITSEVNTLKAGETATITFTLSETSTDFVASDITVVGGVLSNFVLKSGETTIYTATFTPAVNSTTPGTISVASNKFTNSASNNNADGSDANNTVSLTIDTVTPTIAITSDASTLKAGDTATITFTLSEASTDFVASDITVVGGVLSNFVLRSGEIKIYTATFTPAANSTTTGTISVATGKFTDIAGNNNADGPDANNLVSLTIDTVAPTIAITSERYGFKAGDTATITFTLSEVSTDFVASDITVVGGVLSNFALKSGETTVYTATFTPAVNSTTPGTISVASNKFTNSTSNNNVDGSDANNTVSLIIDTVIPTIAITSDASTLRAGETATITFTLSEVSTDFVVSDITVAGGVLSNFALRFGETTVYTATFTPAASSTTMGTISVASGKFTDVANNSNADGSDTNNSVSLIIDTIIPTIAITSEVNALKAGDTTTITFTLSEVSTDFVASDITVAGGVLSNFALKSGETKIYTATFTPAENSTTTGTISVANGKFTDAAGNNNADGSDTNNSVSLTIDTVTPTIAITSEMNALKAGDTTTITFTLSEVSTDFVASDITVAGGVLSNFALKSGETKIYTATFTPAENSTTTGTISVANGKFTDAAGNNNADGSDTNNSVSLTINTVIPTIAITSEVNALKAGDTTTITFTLSEVSTDFVASDITVAGGVLSNFALKSGETTVYTATFTPAVNSTTPGTISVASNKFTNSASNNNADGSDANNTVSLTIDTVAPTIAITSDASTLKAGETAAITFTFSETPTGFANEDITLAGGSLSAVTVDDTNDKVYTATFTPITDSTTVGAISIASNTFSDAAGNANTAGTLATNINIDTLAPVATTFSGDITPATDLTMTFSETVVKVAGKKIAIYKVGETTAEQTIVLASDTSDGVTINNTNNTISINPTSDLTSGYYYVKIETGAFKDTAGNDYAGITESTGNTAWTFAATSLSTTVVWSGTGVDISDGINKTEYDNITITGQLNIGRTVSSVGITAIKFIAQDSVNSKEYTTEILPTANNGTWVLDNDKVKALGLVNNETYKIEVTISAESRGNAIVNTSSNNTLVLIDIADSQAISNIAISTDAGTAADDFITNTATQTITATLSKELDSNEKLYYRLDGVANVENSLTGWMQVASSDINNNNISIANLTLIIGADRKIAFKVVDATGNENAIAEQAYTLDTTRPNAVDLSTDKNEQSASTTFTNVNAISTGVAFDADIQAPTATDIKTIKVVLGGAGLDTTHDELMLDSDLALDTDITTVTDKTIGGVNGLEYSYIASSKTWTISKTLGNLTTANVETIVEALKLKNTDVAIQAGIRTATISYIDTAGNEGISAMASLEIEGNCGFVINGETTGDYNGFSVSSAGDVNGDGLDDLIIGALLANEKTGKSYVVFGKTNANAINLGTIANGTGGFVINGETAGDYSGFSVSSAGDVNGDGLDDLIVSSRHANHNAGKSYVVFGKINNTNAIELSAIANGTGGFVINGESAGDESGWSVSSAGDVNGDGLDDLIIGADAADPTNRDNAGKSYVVFGKSDNTNAINLSAIANGTGGFVINGEAANDGSGHTVSSAGDVNGDGLDDLIIGADTASPTNKDNAGKSYVVFGKSDNTNAINLSAIASGTGGFVINGERMEDWSGWSVSSAGDVNGDGLDDVIVGAPHASISKTYVVFGKTDSTAVNLSVIAKSTGTGGFVIEGENESMSEHSGWSVSSAGDVNGDGLDDLIVGARNADPDHKYDAGKSYVIFGKTNSTSVALGAVANGVGGFVINGAVKHGQSGWSVSSAGDVNGDGLDDLIVGAIQIDNETGQSYVIFGKTDTKAIELSKLGDNSKYAIDLLGDANANSLTGTSKDEIFVAGAGDDKLTGNGGMDVFSAGAGDDTIIINASNITALEKIGTGNRANINGGGNVDTLKLDGSNLTLDFTKISNNRIKDIEKIDLTGSGDNTFKVNLNDVLDASTSTNILKVLGDSGDKVDIDTTKWTSSETKTENSVVYKVYTHADVNVGANAALWIDTDLSVI